MAPTTKTVGEAASANRCVLPPTNGTAINNSTLEAVSVNRKKQKRREKQAARQAAVPDQQTSSNEFDEAGFGNGRLPRQPADLALHGNYGEVATADDYLPDDVRYPFSDDGEAYTYNPAFPAKNGDSGAYSNASVKGRLEKKKNKSTSYQTHDMGNDHSTVDATRHPALPKFSHAPPPPPPPPLHPPVLSRPIRRPIISDEGLRTLQRRSEKPDIWDTSSLEERARIKEFWLSLGEDERKSLVKIEKEAVLRKMKEQQKHHCSCTVCGRKRTAIEEELEVLYDAYYEELEQYANHGEKLSGNETSAAAPPRPYAQPTTRLPPDRLSSVVVPRKPSRGRIQELPDDEEDEYEDEAGDEDYSEDEYDEDDFSGDDTDELPPNPATDFFTFGNSLTVKGGILTVADDLLENDGRKFIQMMEQLAERRMQREEELSYNSYPVSHPPLAHPHAGPPHPAHNHAPPPEEEDYDDEEEDEYDSQDDEYDEEDEMDTMTEEQRMEEGRRMFQIFAARMFEQRVLTAYKEKVALERQQKLIDDELNEKSTQAEQSAKKARDAEKRRQKKQQQKQKQQEDKAKKEEAEAAKAAAMRAEEEKKHEEQRQKKEDQRKKKEAERKALEEEKQRKEAEKQRRQLEERERQQDIERKQREQKAEEKKGREEAKQRDRDQREAKDKAARDRRAHEEKDKAERAEKARADREAIDRTRREEQAAHIATAISKRPSLPAIVALPPSLRSRQSTIGHASPLLKVATPVIPKAPTLARPKDVAPQPLRISTPHTPETAPQSKQSSPPKTASSQQSMYSNIAATRLSSQQPPTPYAADQSPLHTMQPPPGVQAPHSISPHPGVPVGTMNGFPNSQGPTLHGMMPRMPLGPQVPTYTPHAPHASHGPSLHRPFLHQYPGAPPPGMGFPGMQQPSGRLYGQEPTSVFLPQILNSGPGSAQNIYAPPRDSLPSHTHQHSRQQSKSFESPQFELAHQTAATQPIARPAPIKRPASAKPHEYNRDPGHPLNNSDMDDLSNHLGSSALIDENDDPLPAVAGANRRQSGAPGMPMSHSASLVGSPFEQNHPPFSAGGRGVVSDSWRSPAHHFGASNMSHIVPGWGSAQSSGWSAFPMASQRSSIPRPVTVRMLACQACKILSSQGPRFGGGFHDISNVVRQAESLRHSHEQPIQITELRDILDTEGDSQNGGGTFIVNSKLPNRTLVKWEPDASIHGIGSAGLGLGEIGSPIVGSGMPTLSGLGAGRF